MSARARTTAKERPQGPGVVTAPARGTPAAQAAPASVGGAGTISNLGFRFLLVFVFFSSSRLLDFSLNNLHLPLILSLLAAGFTALGGGLQRAFGTRIGRLMGLFTVWLMVCTVFSEWKGGSFSLLRDVWMKSFLVFIVVAGATITVAQVRRMMIAIALGAAGAMVLAHVLHGNVDGRLSLPVGYLGNPNDLAQIMLVGFCFLPILLEVRRNLLTRLLVAAIALPLLYSIFETGSRGALIATAAIAGLMFVFAPPARKILLFVGVIVLGAGLSALSPVARTRMMTLFSSNDAADANSAQAMAVASTENRTTLLKDSLLLTLRNPLFGVGPGVFASSAADFSHEQGQRALWRETHNSYTQVSSETGIPGALLFIGAVGSCIGGLVRIRKKTRGRSEHHALQAVTSHLLLGFLAFAFTSFFSSVAYQFYFSLLIGLCAATIRAAENELVSLPVSSMQTSNRIPVLPGSRAFQYSAPKRVRG